ncbi:MAG: molybdate ABC transporter ATP-binding protein ModF [Gammaproteobacteria bacterium]|nr:molybdate ABC transporter ATP-binding protein ModF [Gammaproteobacteria bacterium]
MTIQYQDAQIVFDSEFHLSVPSWQLSQGEHWLIVGGNGAGKSALAATLLGEGDLNAGSINGLASRIGWVSFEAQERLIAAELKKDDADILDVISEGTPVRELVFLPEADHDLATTLCQQFGIEKLLDRAFRKLSTGETRKVLLVRALSSKPEMLVLDEPFDGLDVDSHAALQHHLKALSETLPIVMVLNRLDERPEFVTHMALVRDGVLVETCAREDKAAVEHIEQLLHIQMGDIEVPRGKRNPKLSPLNPDDPLVRLRNARVAYTDNVVFEGLEWTINPGEHWQLSGPNGSGKTCLLSLITGDHPQCYVNDIFVFGMQRGQGESIWQIKEYIGYVSTALQWQHRVSVSARNVIISGFYDSIGLYSKASDEERAIADQWLALLGLQSQANTPYNSLSFGAQRMLLIARAMVKHPPLLILDEPCLGLDELNRHKVLALIERICADNQTTVLYVNHHPHDRISGIEHFKALG